MSRVTPNLWQRLCNGPRERQAIAFLRLATGLFFLYVGYQKFENPDFPVLMAENLKTWAAGNPILIYQAFVETVIIPNGLFFAKLITYGEMAIGISYLLGFFIRYSAPAALFLNLNFLLATQQTGTTSIGLNLAFMLIHFTLLWSQSGHCYGMDTFAFPRNSQSSRKTTVKSVPGKVKSLQKTAKPHREKPAREKAPSEKTSRRLKAVTNALEKQQAKAPRVVNTPAPKPAPAHSPAKSENPLFKGIIDLRD